MSKPHVLVTGATGHIGFRTLVLALESGYHAHVTTRSKQQWAKIANASSIKPHAESIKFFLVPDMTADDAYDEAIKGVQYVIHLASPIPSVSNSASNESFQELFYDPARKGTLAMVQAAANTASVRRVVITSSIIVLETPAGRDAAGPYDLKPGLDLEAANKTTDFVQAYGASKVMAQTAADDFVRANKGKFDLIYVIPGHTLGANELTTTREEMLNGSNGATIRTALGQREDGEKLTAQVLLDDVARAHIEALKPEVARNGDSFLLAGNGGLGIPWDTVAAEIEKQYPQEVARGDLKPAKGQQDWMTRFDVESSEKALGYKFAGVEEMVRSVIRQYLALAPSA